MKRLLGLPIMILCGLCLVFTSCDDDKPIGDTFADDQYGNGDGVVIAEFADVTGDSYIIPAGDESFIGFDVVDPSEGGISSADLLLKLNDGDPVVYKTITSFPDTTTITLSEATSAFGLTPDDVTGDDVAVMMLDATTSSGVYRSSSVLSAPFIDCPSSIDGELNYKSYDHFCWADMPDTLTGTVNLTKVAGIEFTFDDWAMGTYPHCYDGFMAANWGTLTLRDLCEEVTIRGLDNYDDTWTWNITGVSGSTLTVKWENTYGEGSTTELTRADGSAWPNLTTN